jgi:cytochrome c oxidase cbb3-type subunit 1
VGERQAALILLGLGGLVGLVMAAVGTRRAAAAILLLGTLVGFAMAAAGAGEAFGAHGFIVMAFCAALLFAVLGRLDAPEPPVERLRSYYDDPTKVGIVLAMIWGAVGMALGLWVAYLLAWPDLTFDAPWASFGRLRPAHTTAVIFGFGGSALIATSFQVMQRTSRARLAGELSPWFVLIGYQLFVILAVSGYLMGINQSKEYAEAEWYADLWLVVVWVAYFVLYIRTLARRTEPHIYVANWYYLAFILIVAVLHIVNNLAIPVSWGGSQSYILWSGVQDSMIQWWYGHNAVAFFLTAGFLGMLYYYLPKRAERPIYSYRLSILSFWGIVFFYVWAGSHHLHYTALPHWVQTLGMTFSVMLLVPSWATAANALLTLNGAWHKVRDDATLRFMMVAAIFYGITTFEGSFLAIRGVNALSHYTDWTVAHVHAGALGWNAILIFGAVYAAVPVIWRRERMWSPRLVEWHFWLAVMGTVVYVFAMWNAGILQGLMWRTYTDAGTLRYSFIESVLAMNPYYVARAVGGTMFFVGTLLGIWNIWMTIRQAPEAALALDRPAPPREGEAGERGVPAE